LMLIRNGEGGELSTFAYIRGLLDMMRAMSRSEKNAGREPIWCASQSSDNTRVIEGFLKFLNDPLVQPTDVTAVDFILFIAMNPDYACER